MTTVWGFLLHVSGLAVTWMKATTIFYGVSVWQICMAFFSLWVLAWIIGAIFKHDDGSVSG